MDAVYSKVGETGEILRHLLIITLFVIALISQVTIIKKEVTIIQFAMFTTLFHPCPHSSLRPDCALHTYHVPEFLNMTQKSELR
jgi:hypothetical protein